MLQRSRILVDQTFASFGSNRRLQIGAACVALLLCTEGGLRWNDHLDAKLQRLEQTRSELRSLRSQSGDEAALRKTLARLEAARENVDRRLWLVSSDALGQAHLKDWLIDILKKVGIQSLSLKISAPQILANDASADTARQLDASDTSPDTATHGGLRDLREIRATLSIPFTPANLERVLSEIEGGEAFADIESLTVSPRDRRAEMTVRVLTRIGRNTKAVPAHSAEASAGNGGGARP